MSFSCRFWTKNMSAEKTLYRHTAVISPVGNEESSKQVLNFSRKLFAGKIAAGKLWVDQKSVILDQRQKVVTREQT